MTARRDDNAARGVVYAVIPSLIAWAVVAVLVMAFAAVVPASVGLLLAAGLILGPLLVWAFRRT